jgi:N-acetylmuramic acid 6-phosphate (MurNAc-6-P) etherase
VQVSESIAKPAKKKTLRAVSLSRPRARALLTRAAGKLKAAPVMHFRRVDLQDALRILDDADQFLCPAIGDAEPA